MADNMTITDILHYMPDVIGVRNFKASEGMKQLWYETLMRYPNGLVKAIAKKACQSWEYTTKIPPLALISRLCEELYTPQAETPQYMIDGEDKERRYQEALLTRNSDEIEGLRQFIFNGVELSDREAKAKERTDMLMEIWDYKLDPYRIVNTPKDPLHRNYKVIYAESVEGDKPLPKPVKGNIMDSFNAKKKKVYDEDHFKKEKARERSLQAEEQRECGQ